MTKNDDTKSPGSNMLEETSNQDSDTLSIDELYRQNWLQVRHVENRRQSFTTVYMVIVAGTLAFLADRGVRGLESVALLWVNVVLSTMGLLISIRLRADLNAHGEKLRAIVAKHDHSEDFTFGAEEGLTTAIKLRNLFWILHSVLLILFLWLAVVATTNPAIIEQFRSLTVTPSPSATLSP